MPFYYDVSLINVITTSMYAFVERWMASCVYARTGIAPTMAVCVCERVCMRSVRAFLSRGLV